jgi:EAL domain-containing protein (putative c-di-GMP-specific phosphodiesterase class I)
MLAQSLGLPMVAEGIETAEALQRLTDYGCGIGQGYYIARPAPADQLTDWICPGLTIPAERHDLAVVATGADR